MSLAASEVAWLQNLVTVMGLQQTVTPLMLCDNLSAVCLTANPRFHKRTKHFEVNFHYVRERVALKKLEVRHIPATLQLADIFTKYLPQDAFFKLRTKLGVSSPLTLSLRGSNSHNTSMLSAQGVGPQKEKQPTTAPTVKKISCGRTTLPAHGILTSNRFDAFNQCAGIC